MAGTGGEKWPGGSEDLPDFGPPGPADADRFDQSVPPPPPAPVEQPPASGYLTTPPAGPYPACRSDPQGVGALIVGVMAILFSFFCALIGIPLAIVAIVLGAQGRKKGRAAGMPTGMATAGLVLGTVSLVVAVGWTVGMLALSAASS